MKCRSDQITEKPGFRYSGDLHVPNLIPEVHTPSGYQHIVGGMAGPEASGILLFEQDTQDRPDKLRLISLPQLPFQGPGPAARCSFSELGI